MRYLLTEKQIKKLGLDFNVCYIEVPMNPTKPCLILTEKLEEIKRITLAEAFKLK